MGAYTSYIVGIGGIIGVMVLWAFVQQLWKKIFSEDILDDDVLAGRSSCGDCGCSTICSKHKTFKP